MRVTLLSLTAVAVQGILFDARIRAGVTKCYSEEIGEDALFVAEVLPRDVQEGVQVLVSMRQPREYYYNETSPTLMKTAFTTPRKGHVDVCLRNLNKREAAMVNVRLLYGALARDFSQIAKKEHLDPVVKALQAVENSIQDYRSKQMFLVGREPAAREMMDSTHRRVVILAGVNVGAVILCNVVTVLFLRSFFRAKKII